MADGDAGDTAGAFVQSEEFFAHDNGGRPFKVVVRLTERPRHGAGAGEDNAETDRYRRLANVASVSVYSYRGQNGNQDDYNSAADLTFDGNVTCVWVGRSPEHGVWGEGNSVLIEILDSGEAACVMIGASVFRFPTPDAGIADFVSPVGNSDVPYPYAIDGDGNYVILEMESASLVVPAPGIGPSGDPWNELFWGPADRRTVTQLVCVQLLVRA
jgi:hypothetical protein